MVKTLKFDDLHSRQKKKTEILPQNMGSRHQKPLENEEIQLRKKWSSAKSQ